MSDEQFAELAGDVEVAKVDGKALAEAVLDKIKKEIITEPIVSVRTTVDNLAMIAHMETCLKHIEATLDIFAAHEKAAVQKWLLDVKNRVRSLLSRIV